MALTQQQISGLNALAGKKNLTATDLANLNYAKSQGYTLPSTSLTAPVVPQGAVPINGAQYGTKELQQANFTNIQPLGNTLYGIPKVPTSLSQEQLNTPTITPTPTLPTSYDPNTFVSSSKAYFDQVMNDYTTSRQEAAKLNEQKLNERTAISKLMETIGKKGTDYQSQLDSLGVTQSTNQLEDLNKQIAAATAAFNKQVVGAESQTADITTGVVGGQVNMIRRQQAAEVGALTSVAQAVQGNIELAYQTAEKSINLKYEPLENQLKQELQQLDFIYQDLSSAEKKQADSRATLLNERLRLIEEQKTEENNVNNIALEAAKNGADMNTINKIRNSKTVGEAIANAGTSLKPTENDSFTAIADPITGQIIVYNKKTGAIMGQAGESLTPTFTASVNSGTLAARNNNPGNLRFAGQAGATQGDGGFAKFATLEDGYNALVADLKAKTTGNTRTGLNANSTLQDLINIYAPKGDGNNPTAYAQSVANALGVDINAKIGTLDVGQLAKNIIKAEDSSVYNAMFGNTNKTGVDALVEKSLTDRSFYDGLSDQQKKAVDIKIAEKGLKLPPVKLTQEQQKDKLYYDRTVEADTVLNKLEPLIAQKGTSWLLTQKAMPDVFKDQLYKQYEQAQRNFASAVLRRESGAAIAQSEFDNVASQYFLQPGDKNDVLSQKQANRLTTMKGIGSSGGVTNFDNQSNNLTDDQAYQEYLKIVNKK